MRPGAEAAQAYAVAQPEAVVGDHVEGGLLGTVDPYRHVGAAVGRRGGAGKLRRQASGELDDARATRRRDEAPLEPSVPRAVRVRQFAALPAADPLEAAGR